MLTDIFWKYRSVIEIDSIKEGQAMNRVKLIGIILMFVVGCSTSHVGKQLPAGNYPEVKAEMQTLDMKLIVIDISTEVDETVNTAKAKGVITIRDDNLAGVSDFNRLRMKILLLDQIDPLTSMNKL